MGGRVSLVDDIQILQEMLKPDTQVVLQSGQGNPSVKLTDTQSGTTVEVKGLPHDSIVIKADRFKGPFAVFNKDLENIRKRADFVIISNDEREKKWVICLETKGGNKTRAEVVAQLKGAKCFISYCKCIGKSFWESEEFLDGYEYRFASVVRLNDPRKRRTEPFYYTESLHDRPEVFLKISRIFSIHFSKLIDPEP